MPAPVLSIGNVVEMTIFTSLGSQLGVNRLHYRVDNYTGSALGIDVIPALFCNEIETTLKDLMPSTATFRGCGARTVVAASPSISYYSNNGTGVGTASGTSLPSQVAPVIRFQTQTPGRQGRGRMYVAFPPTGAIDGSGNVATAYTTKLNLFGAEIGPQITLSDGVSFVDLVLVISDPAFTVLRDVFQVFGTGKLGTQRRRGNYGSPNEFPV